LQEPLLEVHADDAPGAMLGDAHGFASVAASEINHYPAAKLVIHAGAKKNLELILVGIGLA
jgi:hypothetical protein